MSNSQDKKNDLASIRFGKIIFHFKLKKNVEEFLESKEIDFQKLIPTASNWYIQVLKNMNLKHEEKKNVEVVFLGLEKDIITNNKYQIVSLSPLRFKDPNNNEKKEEKIKFGVNVV